jgi:hypothetical protein
LPAAVVCKRHDCDNPLPPGRRDYCGDRCMKTVNMRRYRASKAAKADGVVKQVNRPVVEGDDSEDGRGSARGGPEYDRFVGDGGPTLVDKGLTHDKIAEHYGVSRVTVTHWMAQYRKDLRVARERAGWKQGEEAKRALADFRFFRDRYFKIPRGPNKGKPYMTADFHMRWIDAVLEAIRTGGQLAIMSPPRHGKSDLMGHFCIWQILRDPDVCILWVGGSEDIAKKAVRMVRQQLETNELLVADFAGPGGVFQSRPWTDEEFIVATRTSAQRSPTMKAIGRGGTMLSLDADFIVSDDIESDKTTRQPAQRATTKQWFNSDLASRKEDHTAWMYIGSRQHPEDIWSSLLDNEEWEVVHETAHDPGCDLPVDDYDAHVDCVLFPQVRSYRYLMKKKRTVGDDIYEMQYLSAPRSDGLACRDRSRTLGDIPPRTRLIAGLDPSGKNYTAAILWAVHVESNTRFLVDIFNERGSGILNMRAVFEAWELRYPALEGWAVEQNMIDDTLKNDVPMQELRTRLNMRFFPHLTGRNKWDTKLGVPGMKQAFADTRINLPYADEVTRGKVDVYINQLANFSDAVTSHQSQWRTDLVMAGWFPEKTVQQWCREAFEAEMDDYRSNVSYGFRPARWTG